MAKVRFVCTKHNEDLEFDNEALVLIPERLCDVDKNVLLSSDKDKRTSNWIFNLSEGGCALGDWFSEGDESDQYTSCNDSWAVVITL